MITVKKLHLENFMSIISVDMEFNDNQITAITGQNGQGKSALIDAIAFAITGHRKGESYRNYVRTGTEKAIIHLEADLKGEPVFYDIEIYNGNSKYHSLQPVTRVVEYRGKRYYNSEFSQFLETQGLTEIEKLMFMFQGSNDLIESRPKERATMLKNLFKYIFPDIVEILEKKQESEKQASIEYNAIIDELNSRTFDTLPIMRSTPEEGINQMEERVKEIDGILNKLGNANEDEVIRCDRDIESLQKTINSSNSNMKSNKIDLGNLENTYNEVEKSLNSIDCDSVKNEISRISKELEEHNIQYQKDLALNTTLSEELGILQYKLKELKKQYEISKTGVCHACGQPIEASHVVALEESIKTTEKNIITKKEEIKNLNFDIRDAKGKKIKADLDYNNQRLTDFDTLTRRKADLKSRIMSIRSLIEERENTLKELESKMDILQRKKKELAEVSNLLEMKNSLNEERKETKDRIKECRERNARNMERRLSNERIESQRKERDEKVREFLDKTNKTSINLSKIKTELDIFDNKFPNFVIWQACKQLEDLINDIVQRAFPYCSVSLKMDKGGVNFVYTSESSQDEWIPVSMASGAQRTILGLAYFIALARLSDIDCIFLDEIDAACSPENSEIIYNFIAELDYFPQVFFISHRPEAHEVVKNKNDQLVTYKVESGHVFEC